VHIRKVESRSDLRQFIELPYRLYRNDPVWIPPLRSEQWAQFDPRKNPMLTHCEYDLYLLADGNEIIGRISAFVDHLAVENWQEPIGFFGSYECVQSLEAARLLLDTAAERLRQRGLTKMRGPWSFASQEWGLVIDGYTPSPVILAPYNPPYYIEHMTAYRLGTVKDLLVYYVDSSEGYNIPQRYIQLTDRIQERYGLRVRSLNMKRLEDEVASIIQMSNRSLMDNWGYYEVTEEEGRAIAHDLKQIINPDVVLIAEDRHGQPVGYILPLPDVNVLLRGLNGRLFPLGWLKLLFGLPRLKQYRLWALGVVPEYQGKAVDALMYRRLYEVLHPKGVRLEINYVLEDNVRMNNTLKRLGVNYLRRYRVYEKPL
jgi:GNAT superfamily N-acetyltransferase